MDFYRHLGRRTIAALIGTLVLTLAGIQLRAQFFRFQAEQLLRQMSSLRVGETPAENVLRIRTKYSSDVFDQGACAPQHCQFSIHLEAWESLVRMVWDHPKTERVQYCLVRSLRFFGLRPALLDAKFEVQDGKLRRFGVWTILATLEKGDEDHRGFLSSLNASADAVDNLGRWISRPQIYLHPNVVVWKPSACTGCRGDIHFDFTWQATREETERAFHFDLSCATGFRDCSTPEDLFPGAAEIQNADAANHVSEMWGRVPCDARMARILGRDSDFVNIVRAKNVRFVSDDEFVEVDYEVIKPIKGPVQNLHNIYQDKTLMTDESRHSESSHATLQAGSQRILFLNRVLGKPSVETNCAVMQATRENIEAMQRGVADDTGK